MECDPGGVVIIKLHSNLRKRDEIRMLRILTL
jgi:hypothetical protein